MGSGDARAWVDLYWLPLGAGGHFVRWNGRVYEWLVAHREGRSAANLYHAALTIGLAHVVWTVEVGPVWNVSDADRGVVCEGPVGSRRLGRFRAFRYEVRCWPGGYIPDAAEAVQSPIRMTEDPARAEAVLHVVRDVPGLTWGRDELGTGEMWNSNSVVAWALVRADRDTHPLPEPPTGGRAPGWRAGVELARRQAVDPRHLR